jgi:Ca-activated chloride channel family protein
MILLTDGTNNAGETTPQQAAAIAKAFAITIYAIGTGTRGMALVPARTRDGQTVLQRTRVSIDEETLTNLATTTGGRYFRATDSQALEAIYHEIDQLEKTTTVAERFQHYAERFPLVLLPALGLLGLEVVLVTTRFRTIP